VEVDAVRGAEPVPGRGPAPVCAGWFAERSAERAGERAQRFVARFDRDLGGRRVTSREQVRSPLQKESPAQGPRRLADRAADDPVEVEAAQVGTPSDLRTTDVLIERVDEQIEVATQAVRWNGHRRIMRTHDRPRLTAFAVSLGPPLVRNVSRDQRSGSVSLLLPAEQNGQLTLRGNHYPRTS